MRSRCDKLLVLVLDSLPRERAAGLLTLENRELLDAALARGRGVYLALSHFGPQHIIGTLMAINGYRSVGVRDRNEGAIRKYVQARLRRKYPEIQRLRMLFADSFPREIYRCLEEGHLLGSAIDVSRVREVHHKVEEVTIFGQQRYFPTGPIRIALHCGAPVLQAWIVPEKNFRYRFEIIEMLLDPAETRNDATAISIALKRYAANVERRAMERPYLVTRV